MRLKVEETTGVLKLTIGSKLWTINILSGEQIALAELLMMMKMILAKMSVEKISLGTVQPVSAFSHQILRVKHPCHILSLVLLSTGGVILTKFASKITTMMALVVA